MVHTHVVCMNNKRRGKVYIQANPTKNNTKEIPMWNQTNYYELDDDEESDGDVDDDHDRGIYRRAAAANRRKL